MTSSSVVRWAQIDAEIEKARKQGDLRGMQAGLRQLTDLMVRYYGAPRASCEPETSPTA